MKHGIDTAAEMAGHAQPLSYQPTIPEYTSSFMTRAATTQRWRI